MSNGKQSPVGVIVLVGVLLVAIILIVRFMAKRTPPPPPAAEGTVTVDSPF